MTESQTTQLTRLKAYLNERLEEWKKAPRGPYVITGTDHKSGIDYVKIRGTALGQKWQIADVRFVKEAEYSEEPEAQNLAACLANSGTLAPITYANTLREIVWLEPLAKASDGLWKNNPFGDRLNEILDAFKEVLT